MAASPAATHEEPLLPENGRRLVASLALVHRPASLPVAEPSWNIASLAGRLVELCGGGATAVLTAAFGLVLEAQREGEPVAWIATRETTFYPPDAAANGIDLDALLVVRPPVLADVPRAADALARSTAFGLLVLDLRVAPPVPIALQARLLGLAQKHAIAVVSLAERAHARDDRAPTPFGSLVSLRASVERIRRAPGSFEVQVRVDKDKQHAPGWQYVESCRGPAGVR